MKENFIHVCFIIDESGSMFGTESDIIGGFKKIVDEQRANKNGKCAVSLYKFADKVSKIYMGKDVNDVEYLDEKSYRPGGCTAMNDAIGTAVDEIGKWLDAMDEAEKPEKNLIVIMTDGEENSSVEYSFDKVKEMIKHQEEKYSWSFMYLGTDNTDASYAKSYGFDNRLYTSKKSLSKSYDMLNTSINCYRSVTGSTEFKNAAFALNLQESIDTLNNAYENEIGQKITNND